MRCAANSKSQWARHPIPKIVSASPRPCAFRDQRREEWRRFDSCVRATARESRGQQTPECTSTAACHALRVVGSQHAATQTGRDFDIMSGRVNAGHAGGYGAEKIGGDRTNAARDGVCRMHVFTVGTVDGDDVADFDAGDLGDIDHGYVHGNDADDGGEFSAHEHAAAAVAKRTVYAVAVAGGENGDYGGTLGSEFCTVANVGAAGNPAQANDAGAQAHYRL